MSSGSKKRRIAPRRRTDRPPELTDWQVAALEAVAESPLASEVALGGGVALAALHLHHRLSEDLDFFLTRELEPGELRPVVKRLAREGTTLEQQQVGPRQSTVNKLQALLTRFQPRDFVDMYFLLREGPELDVDRLLGWVRAKFDVGADRLGLAQRLLMASFRGGSQDVEPLGLRRNRQALVGGDEGAAPGAIPHLNEGRAELQRVRGREGVDGQQPLGALRHDPDGVDLDPGAGEVPDATEHGAHLSGRELPFAGKAARGGGELDAGQHPDDDRPVRPAQCPARDASLLLHEQRE